MEKALKWHRLLLLSVLLLGTTGCEVVKRVESVEPAAQQPAPAATPVSQETGPTVGIGEYLTIGDARWRVATIPKSQSEIIASNGSVVARATGAFVIFTLAVDASGTQEMIIDSSRLAIVDANGRRFPPTTASAIRELYSDEWLLGQKTAVGATVEGTVIFEVAADATGLKLEITDPASAQKGYVRLGL